MALRPRRDLDDLDDSLFSHEEATRRREARAHERALAAERAVMMDKQDAILQARAKAAFVGTSEAMIRAEYAHAGVEPRPGTLVSLGTLRSIGWTIEEFAGTKTLVAPARPPTWDGHRDRDSLPKGECS